MLLLKLICFLSILFIFPQPITAISPSQPTNITLYNDASFNTTSNSISLTQPNCTTNASSTINYSGIGRAFYAKPVRFLDPLTNSTSSFSCNFTFTIKNSPSCAFGNGMAFIITSNVEAFSLGEGYMGLPEELGAVDSGTRVSYFAVEFDTSFEMGVDVLESEHVGVNVNGVHSLESVDVMSTFGISFKEEKEISVWVEYDGSLKEVSVWVGYVKGVRPRKPVIALRIDLSREFMEFMNVGFTAGNGRGSSIYTVRSWRFRPLGEVSGSGLPVEDSECLICEKLVDTDSVVTGVDFIEDHYSDNGFLTLVLIVGGVCLAVVLLAVSIMLCLFVRRRERSRRARSERHLRRCQDRGRVPKMLSLNEIQAATNGFSVSKVIGEGASTVVYRGDIPSCGEVAVKRFNNDGNFLSSSIPFTTEFGSMIGCLSHKNLAKLLGWCCEKDELVLVYEHLANGSLDKILHTRSNLSKFLTWEQRMNIIQGVASALIYLQEEYENQIIHRDIKTCNILLDSELNAKLCDFGLAEVYRHSFRTRGASVPAGTMGYLAPEYVFTGVPTAKTDVFSFGVVVLEVATGRKPLDERRVTVGDYVGGLWEKGNICEAADPKLNGNFDKIEMERVLTAGLWCAHFNCNMRPNMKEAARMLRGEAPLPVLPSKKPTARIRSVLPESCDEIMSLGGASTVESSYGTPETHFSKNY